MKKSVFILLLLFTNHLKAQKIIWGEATKKEYNINKLLVGEVAQDKENYYFDFTQTYDDAFSKMKVKDKIFIFSKESLKCTEENTTKPISLKENFEQALVSVPIKIETKKFRLVSYHEINKKAEKKLNKTQNNYKALIYIAETDNEGKFIEQPSPLFTIDVVDDSRMLYVDTKPRIAIAKDSSCIVVYNVVQEKETSQIHYRIVNADYSVKSGIINLSKLYKSIEINHFIAHDKNRFQFLLFLGEDSSTAEMRKIYLGTYNVEKQKNDLIPTNLNLEANIQSFYKNNLLYIFYLNRGEMDKEYMIQAIGYDSEGNEIIRKKYSFPESNYNTTRRIPYNMVFNDKNQGLLAIENVVTDYNYTLPPSFRSNVSYFLVNMENLTFKSYILLKNQVIGNGNNSMGLGIKTISDGVSFYIFYNDHKKNAFLKEGARVKKYLGAQSGNFCIKIEPDGKTERISLNIETLNNKKILNPVMILSSIMYDKDAKLFYGIGMYVKVSSTQKFNLFKIVF